MVGGMMGGGGASGRNVIEIVLGLDDQASRKFDDATRRALDNARKMQRVGKQMAMAGAAITGAFIKTAHTFASSGDEIAKMARRTGLGTEMLSELRYAAMLSGTEIAGLEVGIRRMHRTVYDARRGLSTASDALEALGINIEELEGLTPEETFMRFMHALAGVEDHGTKVALALEAFGRQGTALLPMLDGGTDRLDAMMKEAHRFGGIITGEAGVAAELLTDQIGRLKTGFWGLQMTIGEDVAPILSGLIDRVLGVFDAIQNLNPETKKALVQFGFLAGIGLMLSGVLIYVGFAVKSAMILMGAAKVITLGLAGSFSVAGFSAAPLAIKILAIALAADVVYRAIAGVVWVVFKLVEAFQRLLGARDPFAAFAAEEMKHEMKIGMVGAGMEAMGLDPVEAWRGMIGMHRASIEAGRQITGEHKDVNLNVQAQIEESGEVLDIIGNQLAPELA